MSSLLKCYFIVCLNLFYNCTPFFAYFDQPSIYCYHHLNFDYKLSFLDANNYSEQYGVYERVRSAEVLSDLKERNSLNKAAWDDLTQDIPYQKGIKFY